MAKTSVSIVTAVLNRKHCVARALRSVSEQTYTDVEHVVVDGGSTDGTVDEVERHSHARMRLFAAPDNGPYEAINRGISKASGEIIGLLHSDDVYAGRDVLDTVAFQFEDPHIGAVYGDLVYVHSGDERRVVRYWRAGVFRPSQLALGWMPPHPTLFVRRRILYDLGLYDTSYKIAADYDAILRWFKSGRLHAAYIPQVLVRMTLGGASNGSLRQIFSKMREDYRAARMNRVGGITTVALKNLRKLNQFRWSVWRG